MNIIGNHVCWIFWWCQILPWPWAKKTQFRGYFHSGAHKTESNAFVLDMGAIYDKPWFAFDFGLNWAISPNLMGYFRVISTWEHSGPHKTKSNAFIFDIGVVHCKPWSAIFLCRDLLALICLPQKTPILGLLQVMISGARGYTQAIAGNRSSLVYHWSNCMDYDTFCQQIKVLL